MSDWLATFTISFLIASVIGNLIAQRRGMRHAYKSGYWAGRSDESLSQGVLHMLMEDAGPGEENRMMAFSELQQLVAQQTAKRLMEPPLNWAQWDGIDRLAIVVPDELHPHVFPPQDTPPSFMRPFRWPWSSR